MGDGVGGCFQGDLPEDLLADVARDRRRKPSELALCLLEKVVPSGPPEIGESLAGKGREVGEVLVYSDYDREVVGIKGGERGPGGIEGKVGATKG